MNTIKLQDQDLILGQPLPWPVYDRNLKLLLTQGVILTSEKQKKILLAQGVYRQPTNNEEATVTAYFSGTPFDRLDAIKQAVASELAAIVRGQHNDCQRRFLDLAAAIQKLCHENADAALGALILDQKALYTHLHPILCAILTELLTRRRKIPVQDRQLFIAAAFTQNIGMLFEQESLTHQNTPLTTKQRKLIDEHPYRGREMLQFAGIDQHDWLNAVLLHHERFDGKGYPHGFSGTAIPEPVRILSLSDIYSAMVLPRQYRNGLFVKQALRDIFLQRGNAVDGELTALLIKEMGIYPPGAFVRLANGETAVVLRRGLKNANTPLVLSLLSPRRAPYSNPQHRDTQHEQLYGIVKVIPRINDLKFSLSQLWGLSKR